MRIRLSVEHRHCEELLVDSCKTFFKESSKSLSDLLVLLKESKQFPVVSFHFDHVENFFGNEDMMKFMSMWGENILNLKIDIEGTEESFGMLRQLLCKQVPNLKKLAIKFAEVL